MLPRVPNLFLFEPSRELHFLELSLFAPYEKFELSILVGCRTEVLIGSPILMLQKAQESCFAAPKHVPRPARCTKDLQRDVTAEDALTAFCATLSAREGATQVIKAVGIGVISGAAERLS